MRTSITTLGYRNDILGNRQSYKAGDVVDIEIVALPVVWTVKAGNRLRVDVKSSNFPEYAIHPNYPGVWCEQPQSKPALQTIFTGDCTYLDLPLLR